MKLNLQISMLKFIWISSYNILYSDLIHFQNDKWYSLSIIQIIHIREEVKLLVNPSNGSTDSSCKMKPCLEASFNVLYHMSSGRTCDIYCASCNNLSLAKTLFYCPSFPLEQ